MSIADKLLTVANNTPDVAEAVNAARATASGTVIRVDDALDVEHPLQVQLRSKNLLDYTKATGRNAAQKVEIVDDGVVWKAGGDYYFEIPVSIPVNTTVTCSWVSGNDAGEYILYWQFSYTDGTYSTDVRYTNGTSHAPEKDVKSIYLYKYTPTTKLTQDLLVSNIQLELGSKATSYTPYMTEFSCVNITRYGKNLANVADITEPIDVASWRTEQKTNRIFTNFKENTQYTISCEVLTNTSNNWVTWQFYYTDGTNSFGRTTEQAVVGTIKHTSNAGKTVDYVLISYATGNFSITVRNIHLEMGTEATAYAPYQKPQKATADADGKVTGLSPISPTMTMLTDSAGVSVECTYFPQSAADIYGKYKQIRQQMVNLSKSIKTA